MSENHPPPQVVFAPTQGVVGIATGTIDALRTSPVLLVMVLLNCAFLGVAAYYLRTQQQSAFTLVQKVLDRCLPDAPPHYQRPLATPENHSDAYPPSELTEKAAP